MVSKSKVQVTVTLYMYFKMVYTHFLKFINHSIQCESRVRKGGPYVSFNISCFYLYLDHCLKAEVLLENRNTRNLLVSYYCKTVVPFHNTPYLHPYPLVGTSCKHTTMVAMVVGQQAQVIHVKMAHHFAVCEKEFQQYPILGLAVCLLFLSALPLTHPLSSYLSFPANAINNAAVTKD